MNMAHTGRPADACDPFIVATGRDTIKPDGQARKFIRSHVMQGKNKGKGSTRAGDTRKTGLPAGLAGAPNDHVASAPVPSPERTLSIIQTSPISPAVGGLVHNCVLVLSTSCHLVYSSALVVDCSHSQL